MKPNSRWQQIQMQVNALTLRERALLLGGAFMLLFLFWDALLMSDIAAQSKRVSADIHRIQDRIAQLNNTMTAAAQSRGTNPNLTLQEELGRLRGEIGALDAALNERNSSIISPAEMAKVLENVLARHGRLKLLGVRSLGRQAMFETVEGGGDLPGRVYRHGFELDVEGRYLDVLAYLRELEKLSARFFWDRIVLETQEYPVNRVRIVVYSLNLEEGWLGV